MMLRIFFIGKIVLNEYHNKCKYYRAYYYTCTFGDKASVLNFRKETLLHHNDNFRSEEPPHLGSLLYRLYTSEATY